MSKRTNVYLTYATAFAVLSTVFLIAAGILASDLILAWSFPRGGDVPVPWPLIVLAAWVLLTVFWILGLSIFYIAHVIKTNPGAQKVPWVVFILLAHILAMPVYWHLFIRPEVIGPTG